MASALPFIADDFNLSPLEMGGVLSAFFFSYAIFQIPGGLMADRFGPRIMLTVALIWWSIFTALTGFSYTLTTLIIVRILFGIGEGVFPPAAFKTISAWFPRREVGRANGFMLTTNALGPALAPLFVSAVVIAWDWHHVFTTIAIPGFVLAFFIWKYVKNSPAQSKYMTPEELADYTDDTLPATTASGEKIGIKDLFKMPLVWFCFMTLFFFNIAQWGIMSWLPTYMLKARGFSIAQMGVAASLPFFMGTIGYYVSGHLSDKFFKNNRQMPVIIGAIVGAVFLYLTAIVESDVMAVVCQMIGFFFITIGSAAIFTLPVAALPSQVVGSAMGVVNTAGQVAGFLSPLIVGYILTQSGGSFDIVFYLFVACLLISAVFAKQIKTPQV